MKGYERAEEFFTTEFKTDEEMIKAYEALTEEEVNALNWLIFNDQQ